MVLTRFNPKTFLEHVGEGKTIAYPKTGETIIRQGDPATTVMYLQTGRAKETVRAENGKEAVVGMIEHGFFFGTGGLDSIPKRLSTVVAVMPSIVTVITLSAMRNALKVPSFTQMFMTYLLHHNSQTEKDKIDLLFNNIEMRLARRLVLLAHVLDQPPQPIGSEITQDMLADMIGTTRPRINMFLVKFRSMGLIKYDGDGDIKVMPGLVKFALMEKGSE